MQLCVSVREHARACTSASSVMHVAEGCKLRY